MDYNDVIRYLLNIIIIIFMMFIAYSCYKLKGNNYKVLDYIIFFIGYLIPIFYICILTTILIMGNKSSCLSIDVSESLFLWITIINLSLFSSIFFILVVVDLLPQNINYKMCIGLVSLIIIILLLFYVGKIVTTSFIIKYVNEHSNTLLDMSLGLLTTIYLVTNYIKSKNKSIASIHYVKSIADKNYLYYDVLHKYNSLKRIDKKNNILSVVFMLAKIYSTNYAVTVVVLGKSYWYHVNNNQELIHKLLIAFAITIFISFILYIIIGTCDYYFYNFGDQDVDLAFNIGEAMNLSKKEIRHFRSFLHSKLMKFILFNVRVIIFFIVIYFIIGSFSEIH